MKITKTVYHELSERIGPADAAMISFQLENATPQTTPYQDGIQAAIDLIGDRIDEFGELATRCNKRGRPQEAIRYNAGIAALRTVKSDLETRKAQP